MKAANTLRRLKLLSVRVLCTCLSCTVPLMPVHDAVLLGATLGGLSITTVAFADPPAGASDGQNLGNSLLQGPSTDGQNIYFNGKSGTESVSVNQLFQTQGASDDVQAMENAYGDNNAASAVTSAVATRLQTENSQQAQAYMTVQTSARSQSQPDLSNDPALSATASILSPSDPLFASFFGDCQQTTAPIGTGLSVHVQDLQYCEKVDVPVEQCQVTHQYDAGLVSLLGGDGGIQSCGDGCIDVFVGKVGNDYLHGNCTVFEQEVQFQVDNGAAITSAVLAEAKYDDYLQILVNGTKVWQGPNGNFPPETAGACDLQTSWDQSPNVDMTSTFQANGLLTFKLRISVGGGGEGYARVHILFDTHKLVTLDNWIIPPECNALLTGISDQACAVSNLVCLNGPAMDVPCVSVNGFQVCQGDLSPGPVPGYSPLCRTGQITANCAFNAGILQCWTDPDGVQHCPANDASQPDGCAPYENNSSCGFVSSTCLPFAEGKSGTCYAFDSTYDCGYNVSTPAPTSTQVTCDGPIRCMGTECVTPPQEGNSDFIKAAGALEAMTFMAQDLACPDSNPENCTVFAGTAMECKRALGGVVNCCNEPVNVGLLQYLELAKATYDLAKKLEVAKWLANEGLDVPGAWSAVSNWASSTWSTITQPFTSAWGSLVQNFGDTGAENIASFSLSALEQSMMSATQEWMSNTFGEQVASIFFTQATDQAGEQVTELSTSFTTALSVIGWVYTVYVIVTVLIGIAWPCEQSEFELAARKQMQLCDRVGTYCAENTPFGCTETRDAYCCYDSPLARIVMQSARPQLGMSFGDPTKPNCAGLTLDELAGIDWSKIDLSQWYGILAKSGLIPSDTAGFQAQYNIDTVTRDPDATAPTPSGPERIQSEVNAAQYFDQAREKIRSDLWNGQQ